MKKKLLFSLLTLLCMMTSTSAFGYDFTYKEKNGTVWYLNYLNDKTEAEVTSGAYDYKGNITIPSTVSDGTKVLPVTTIGRMAFYDCTSIRSIAIPNSVTTIRTFAFWGCTSLTSITIPNSVTMIGDKVFSDCSSLTSITIPNSVTTIGGSVFSDCSSLTSIKVESGNTNYDSRDNCNAIIETASNTLIAGCKNTIIPNSVTTIGKCAFGRCFYLRSIAIPNSVTTIRKGAFHCSSITSITIPNSVTTIGTEAFSNCSSLYSVKCHWKSFEGVAVSTYDTFYDIPSNAILYVPKGTKSLYQSTAPWKSSFFDIVEFDDETAIDTPTQHGVVVSSTGGHLTISGLNDGESISIYSISGSLLAKSTAVAGTVTYHGTSGDIVIVKIGEQSIKVQL